MAYAQLSCFVPAVSARHARLTSQAARSGLRWVWPFFLMLFAHAPCALAQWTPPPGGGDVLIEGQAIGGMLDGTLVESALDVLLEAGDPNAAGSRCAWESQAVNIHVLTEPSRPTYDCVADSNTIAVTREVAESRDAEILAILLSHEWHHVKQYNSSPDTPGEENWPVPCREYAANRAQFSFMCSLMAVRNAANEAGDLVTKPFFCDEVEDMTCELFIALADCLDATPGGHPELPSLPHCAELYCDKSGR